MHSLVGDNVDDKAILSCEWLYENVIAKWAESQLPFLSMKNHMMIVLPIT